MLEPPPTLNAMLCCTPKPERSSTETGTWVAAAEVGLWCNPMNWSKEEFMWSFTYLWWKLRTTHGFEELRASSLAHEENFLPFPSPHKHSLNTSILLKSCTRAHMSCHQLQNCHACHSPQNLRIFHWEFKDFFPSQLGHKPRIFMSTSATTLLHIGVALDCKREPRMPFSSRIISSSYHPVRDWEFLSCSTQVETAYLHVHISSYTLAHMSCPKSKNYQECHSP